MDSHYKLTYDKKFDWATVIVDKQYSHLNFLEQIELLERQETVSFKFQGDRNIFECDFLPTNISFDLFSENFKTIINDSTDDIEWIKCKVVNETMNIEKWYYILKFKRKIDVLNKRLTIYESFIDKLFNRHVRRPAFDKEKIKDLSVFCKPSPLFWKYSNWIYISQDLKKSLEENNIKGFHCSKTIII